MNTFSPIIIGLIAFVIIWAILKTVLKLTAKVFSCGLLALVLFGLLALTLTDKIF